MPPPVPQPTRRQLLLAGSALLGSGLLAACGQDGEDAASSSVPTSSAPTIVIVSSELRTRPSRSRAAAVRTCSGFCRTPVLLTTQPAGTSMLTSKRPKLL